MASSLSDECTPMKREYDSCFNAWFEGYLEPAVIASSAYSKAKAEERVSFIAFLPPPLSLVPLVPIAHRVRSRYVPRSCATL